VLELSGLTFVDSSGMQAFVALQRAMARTGGTLCLHAPTRAVHLVIDALGLRRELHVQSGPDLVGPDERA
jgi:anti-anti-sigma factor